jgi:prevent-host-death family protein
VSDHEIPQRELRNSVAEVLRRAQSGEEFTITVRGHPVARLGPLREQPQRRVDVDRESLHALLSETPVDKGFAKDVAAVREAEESVEGHWDAR